MTKPYLDLTKYHFKQKHGDIIAYGTWCGDNNRQCLVLVPSMIEAGKRVVPCVIPVDNAWKWSEEVGNVRDCAASCLQFAANLGLDPYNQISVMRVLSVIRDHMGDLLTIPVKPTGDIRVVADAFYTDQQGNRQHKEIIER